VRAGSHEEVSIKRRGKKMNKSEIRNLLAEESFSDIGAVGSKIEQEIHDLKSGKISVGKARRLARISCGQMSDVGKQISVAGRGT
jgi:hypothetical protein